MAHTATAARPQRARRTLEDVPAAKPALEQVPVENGHAPGPQADAFGQLGPVSPEKVRKPLGRMRQKLDNSQRAGFHRHWFNDDDKGRLQDALDAGYVHVKGHDGKPMSKVVGTKAQGGPLVSYRMEVPLEFWQQDQAEKIAERRQRQEQNRRGVTGTGQPGEDGRYVPLGPDGQPLTQVRHDSR